MKGYDKWYVGEILRRKQANSGYGFREVMDLHPAFVLSCLYFSLNKVDSPMFINNKYSVPYICMSPNFTIKT